MSEVIGDVHVVVERQNVRSDTGRFVAEVDAGARAAAKELADALADMVRAGIIADGLVRSGDLLASVHVLPEGFSATVLDDSDHAAPLEEGAVPHDIPNAFGWGITVHHPGNRAYRFMAEAGRRLAAASGAIVARHMPK